MPNSLPDQHNLTSSLRLRQNSLPTFAWKERLVLCLQMFRDGDTEKPQDYNGPRDAAGIVSYLQKKAGPASKPLTSQAEVLTCHLGAALMSSVLLHAMAGMSKSWNSFDQ